MNRYTHRQKIRTVGVKPIPTAVFYSGSKLIPNIVGVSYSNYPGITPTPTMQTGNVVSQYAGAVCYWYNWNTASGVYNFTSLDSYVDTHAAAGRDVIITFYGTPPFASSDTLPDFNSKPGGSAPPTAVTSGLMTDVTAAITTLVTRYNTESVRSNGGLKKIKAIEVWYNPAFNSSVSPTIDTSADTFTLSSTPPSGAFAANTPFVFRVVGGSLPSPLVANTLYYWKTAGNVSQISTTSGGAAIDLTTTGSGTITVQGTSSYWWGNPTQLAMLTKTVNQAAKAVDSTIKIIGNGWSVSSNGTSTPGNITAFLSASDGTSAYGKDWVDGVSVTANYMYPITAGDQQSNIRMVKEYYLVQLASVSPAISTTLPLYVTEQRMNTGSSNDFWATITPEQRGMTAWRLLMQAAALDIKCVCYNGYESPYLVTNGSNLATTQSMQDWITYAHQVLDGQTMTYCAELSDGTTKVITNGNTYIV